MPRSFCVYILASRSRTLYTGITNNLQRRLNEHREGKVPGFTAQYRIHRLVPAVRPSRVWLLLGLTVVQ